MSELYPKRPSGDQDDPWYQPIKCPPMDPPPREVPQGTEPSPQTVAETSPTPAAAPPKVRHRTRGSLQVVTAGRPTAVGSSTSAGSAAEASAELPPQTTEHDRQSPAARRPASAPPGREDPDKRNYDIGYGKPPKSGQFKPGKSGNPKGRPKGAKNLATVIAEELQKPIEITEDGRRRKATRLRAMVMQTIKKALSGDLRAFQALVKLDPTLLDPNPRGVAEPTAEADLTDQEILDAALAELHSMLPQHHGDVPNATHSSDCRDKGED